MKCEMCGKEGAYMQLNPYGFEVYDDDVEYPLCDECADELSDEI